MKRFVASMVGAIAVAALMLGVARVGWADNGDERAPQPSETVPEGGDVEGRAEPSGERPNPTVEPARETATAVSAPAPPSGEVTGQEGLISVDFKDADIRQVLRIIALKSGFDIVPGPAVEALVTIKLTNVPWEQALDIILRTYGFTYERKGKIVRVLTVEEIEKEALATEVFPLDYAKAKEVPDVIKEMLSDRGKVKFDERTNTVIVTDIPSNLFQIKQVVERIDQRTPQVLVETKIVETKLEKDENLGIDWSDSFSLTQTQTSLGSTFPFPIDSTLGWAGNWFLGSPVPRPATSAAAITDPPTNSSLGEIGIGTLSNSQFVVTLNFLKQRSDTKVISNPTLTVLNNQKASILIGEEFPVPQFAVDPNTGNTTVSGFQTKEIGTVLEVIPHVNPSKEIVVDLKPQVISALANATFQIGATSGNSVSLPRFSTQKVETQVRIPNGHTIAIGGLVKTIDQKQENRVPFLGDLPIIGVLFTNTHRFGGSTNPTLQQDLLIFLTVHLAEDEPRTQTVATVAAE